MTFCPNFHYHWFDRLTMSGAPRNDKENEILRYAQNDRCVLLNIALGHEQLGGEDRATGGAADGIMM